MFDYFSHNKLDAPDLNLVSNLDFYHFRNLKCNGQASLRYGENCIKHDIFMKSFETFLGQMDFKTLQFKDIWFQQYKKDNTHHWHIHGCTFTGVYYVKYNEKCIGTELIDPVTKKVMMPAVYEGDVIVFPSYVKHRAPPQITNTLKTIISFNFDCDI